MIEHVIASTPALAPGPGGGLANMNVAAILAMQQNILDIQQRLVLVQARLLNESIRRRNAQALSTPAAAANDVVNRLLPLNKEVDGLGAGLPGATQIPAFPAIEVGNPVGDPFPATPRALFALSAPAINRLSMMFNDDFGITRRDTLAQKRLKFFQFITAY